jgi:xanthine dehydrogenase molybdenum-binding subunit
VDIELNGHTRAVDFAPGTSLLELLRNELGLRSMKDGCAPEGACGACTVIVDGRPVVSCAQPAERFAGKAIETLEGLPDDARELWADAFSATGASQCGFCTPGIVMKAEALLRREGHPDRDTIRKALAGNLCRCTGYLSIIEAIDQVATARDGGPRPEPHRGAAVGDPAPKYRSREQVLGLQEYVADHVVPGMLHGALRFSDHPRAVVKAIDTRPAEAAPGVVAVITAADVPGKRNQGLIKDDWRQLVAVGETTRYVGDVLAAVAAETRAQARAAAALIDIEYEVLEPVTDPFEAMAEGAPKVAPEGNLLSESAYARGDVEAALAASAHVATASFKTAGIEHAYLEPESSLAVPQNGGGPRIHVLSQGQGAWEDRRQVASLLGWEPTDVLVTQVATGGAFGGKEDLNVQGHAALLALKAERPVLLALSRADSLRYSIKRHRFWMDYTVGCDADGKLTAVKARFIGDNGGYASVGMKVLERAAGHACSAYEVPNVDIKANAILTNNPPCGAMRGFGANQANFGMETTLDRLAEMVGIDGWEIRWRNALETGKRFGTGQKLGPGVGLKDTLLAVRDAYRRAKYAGIACGAKNTGIGNGMKEWGRAVVRPEGDGRLTLFHSWTEMGQGTHTVMRQIAGDELDLQPERITVVVDTSHELDTGITTASRATMLGGRAVLQACQKLRAEMTARGCRMDDLAGEEFAAEVLVDWTTKLTDAVEEPITHFGYGWATQVCILDDEGRIDRIVAAHDVGKALDPLMLEGQVVGGVHMGLGHTLSETFETEGGFPVTDTIKSLSIIPASGMPEVETILIEEYQPEGPFGAKGMGEAVLVPTAAAVAGALYAFDGIRRTDLPMRDSPAALAAVPKLRRLVAKA